MLQNPLQLLQSNSFRWLTSFFQIQNPTITLSFLSITFSDIVLTLPCNIEALKQSIGLPPDSDRYLISDYDFPFEILQDTDLDLLNNVCLAISESEIPPEDIPAIQREWFPNLQELEAGLCNVTYHRNCSDMEETSEHFLCVHGRFYEYNE